MSRSDDTVLRFERALQAAVDHFAASLRHHVGGRPSPEVAFGDAGGRLDALLAEDGRLRRKARRNAPSYDLNRHIAVRRLIAACTGLAKPAA